MNIAAYGRMTAAERVRARMPRAQRLSGNADWFRIADHGTGGTARVDLYDEIGFWGTSAADFNAALGAITAERIAVHVNSPGGDVFDGIAIMNLLRAHPAAVDVIVDGLAASAASFIAMAGDTVTVMPNAELMIHDASGLCIGNPADMTEMASLLNHVSDNIASIYAGRAGGTVADWRTAMQAETWYSAQEAVDAGLADQVGELTGGKKPAAASNTAWNLSFYAYTGRAEAPAPKARTEPPPVREFEFDPHLFRSAMKTEAAQ